MHRSFLEFWSCVYEKNNERVDATWATALQLLIGGVILTGTGSVSENWNDVVWNAPFISYLLIIGIFVIAIGWLIYFTLIGSGEVSKVGSYTFLIPVVSIVISALFSHENITINLLVGLLLIVISILLVNINQKSIQKSRT